MWKPHCWWRVVSFGPIFKNLARVSFHVFRGGSAKRDASPTLNLASAKLIQCALQNPNTKSWDRQKFNVLLCCRYWKTSRLWWCSASLSHKHPPRQHFSNGAIVRGRAFPFFPLSPSEHRRLPFDNSIGKQARQSCPLTESGAEWHSGLWAADKRAGRPQLSHNFSNNQCWSVSLLYKKTKQNLNYFPFL